MIKKCICLCHSKYNSSFSQITKIITYHHEDNSVDIMKKTSGIRGNKMKTTAEIITVDIRDLLKAVETYKIFEPLIKEYYKNLELKKENYEIK